MKTLDILKDVLKECKCEVMQNEPMSKHTSFKIGGCAEVFIVPHDIDSLKKIVLCCKKNNIRTTVIGNGTNLLVSDSGIKGAVIKIGKGFDEIYLDSEQNIICGAGVSLSKLCAFALENELSGLEFAWGIPGNAGGAAFMNAGAYGGEMSNVLESVSHIDELGDEGSFSQNQLDLSYRHSVYTGKNFIITSLRLKLKKAVKSDIKEKMDDFMQRRQDKQPLDMPSAGSVFKRPEGHFAGELIDSCNLKGYQIGGAQVSGKHSGFIVNAGSATCNDVTDLIRHIKEAVHKKHGIMLECEIKRI